MSQAIREGNLIQTALESILHSTRGKSMDLDPRKLVYFTIVVEMGSLKKAAKALNLTQPALSHSLSRLEGEIGHRLLERGPSGVSTTLLGDRVYAHARQIRDEIDQIEKFLEGQNGEQESGIRFGALPSLSVSIIPAAIALWRAKHPLAALQVVQKVQIELLESLLAHAIDFFIGVTDLYDHLSGLKQRVLFREKLHVIARASHPLVGRRDVTWAELAAYPWVTPPAGRHSTLLENILRSQGIPRPQPQTFSSSISMLKSLVASGDSLALLPLHAIAHEVREGKIAEVLISSPMLSRNIALFMREGFSIQSVHGDLIDCTRQVGLEISRARVAA